jgi:hypothetical protein
MRAEANLLLDHVTTHRGRIAVDDPGLGFKPVNLDALPAWWPAQAHAIVTGWRPPARPPGNHAALLRVDKIAAQQAHTDPASEEGQRDCPDLG